ncbi:tRNA dihydrouridine synthase [Mangrovibacterium lignilyticum]|uniref:tRNA dihydrouridine synthase n=1 Tax=Mangrovibacterium lignilyticum TaxID=2668052 RepID=UPI0013D65A0A|nr:tRNA-dihydrouridine synthase family protein [Mangrovibacterium lignilyticum]
MINFVLYLFLNAMASNDLFYLAPLQGFTDYVYRKCYHQLFGDIDTYYIPYISFASGHKIRNSQMRDLLPENNSGVPVIPQILCSDEVEMKQLASLVKDHGYQKLNLNLGCPYPMATNRGRGAALLEKPDELKRILDALFSDFEFEVSLKFRAGMTDEQSIFQLIEILKVYPFTQLIFHPRTADQLYKAEANRSLFAPFVQVMNRPIIYNGDINSIDDLDEIRKMVPDQNQWMIGRGVLSNPFLIGELNGKEISPEEKKRLRLEFHELIFETYQQHFSDKGQLLMKMKGFWSYFANSFTNPHKAFKSVKKSSSLDKFKQNYPAIFQNYEF